MFIKLSFLTEPLNLLFFMRKSVLTRCVLPNPFAFAGLLWAALLWGPGTGNAQSVTGFRLVNADTDQTLYWLGTGSASNYINYATLPTQRLNVEATTTGTVGSVVFKLDGNVFRIENAAPYALAGNNGPDYYPWTPGLGGHNLTATAYPQPNGEGSAGNTLLSYFFVTDVAPPANLAAAAVSPRQINLSWVDNATNEAYFTIERQFGSSQPWVKIGYAAANARTYADTTLQDGSSAQYRVYAVKNEAIRSPYSNQAYATTPYGDPVPPADVVAEVLSSTSIRLTWSRSPFGNDYRIEMSVGDTSNFRQYDAVYFGINETTFTGLPPHTTHHFRVRTAHQGKLSPYSATESATTHASHIDDKIIVINANTQQKVDSFYHDTYTVDFAALGTQNLNLVVTTVPQSVGSVVFTLDGSLFRIENVAPYALGGDANGTYNPWTPAVGTHTLSITPYAQPNGQGIAGATRTVRLNVVQSGSSRLRFAGKAEAAGSGIRAYPVPARNKLTVDLSGQPGEPRALLITDARGRVVYRATLGAGQRQVEIDLVPYGMAAGLYLLKVESSRGSRVIKLVKE
jgi:hypothetical protein